MLSHTCPIKVTYGNVQRVNVDPYKAMLAKANDRYILPCKAKYLYRIITVAALPICQLFRLEDSSAHCFERSIHTHQTGRFLCTRGSESTIHPLFEKRILFLFQLLSSALMSQRLNAIKGHLAAATTTGHKSPDDVVVVWAKRTAIGRARKGVCRVLLFSSPPLKVVEVNQLVLFQ